mgnify:FL=1
MKVLALDPGVTTGHAVGIIEDGLMTVSADQVKWSHQDLWDALGNINPDVIVCESFEYRNQSRAGLVLYSCELIGLVKLLTEMYRSVELCMQTASVGKGYYSNTLLKKHGVYIAGKPHGMDALRHLLQWYTFGPGYQYNTKGFK